MPDFSPHIEQVPLAALVPYPNNPKQHPPEQVDLIAGSIREFGFLVPLVIDAKGSIIAGHGRYHAAKKLGLETVPAIRAEHLTTAQIKAYRLADNKLAEGEWDETALDIELEGLKVLGFDLAVVGFGSEHPADSDWAQAFEDKGDTSGVDDLRQITFVLSAVDYARLLEKLSAYDTNKNKAMAKWLCGN